jgi:hypothetical protein
MRKPQSWLKRQKRPSLDVKQAGVRRMEAIDRCELIPKDLELYRAERLFQHAEVEPAPEMWAHVALGVRLDSKPAAANTPEAFRFACRR